MPTGSTTEGTAGARPQSPRSSALSAHTSHGAPGSSALAGARRRRVILALLAVLLPLAAATLAGLLLLWPDGPASDYLPEQARYLAPGVTEVDANVTGVEPFACADVGLVGDTATDRDTVCAVLTAVPEGGDGPVQVEVGSSVVDVGVYPGDDVHLLRLPGSDGGADSGVVTYAWGDVDRGRPLLVLAVAFVLVLAVVARVRGLRALLGLGFAFAVIVQFVLPALLVGRDPLLVGVVGSAAIMFVVLYLAHGISIRTTTALIGTLSGLGIAALLGSWAVDAARLTGVGSEDDLTVRALATEVTLSGLLLCGIVIAGLGILNDVTVTQASAVWELHDLQPDAGMRRLFAGGMRIGRDHIASTVYTVAFAYAGSALPVLLIVHLAQRPLARTLTSEALAQEIVSTLVGAIALALAVPLTTLVGVALVTAAGPPGDGPAGRPDATAAGAPDLDAGA